MVMTIEIANRLIEFRKKFGYSQEELANMLNVSRQSISNWESGEVTPSIDYLKELAKIYGVTMDELISNEKSVEDTLKAHDKSGATNQNNNTDKDNKEKTEQSSRKDDQVHISPKGIHVHSKDGDNVDIDFNGIHINDDKVSDLVRNSFEFNCNNNAAKTSKYYKRRKLAHKIEGLSTGLMALLVFIAYMLLGFFVKDGWAIYWTLFILIPVPGEIISCFLEARVSRFPIAFVATFTYLFFGMYMGLWHPYWVEFLAIPIFYMIAAPIDRVIVANRLDKQDEDSIVTINGTDFKVHDTDTDSLSNIDEVVNNLNSRITKLKDHQQKFKDNPSMQYEGYNSDLKDEADDINDEIDDLEDEIDNLDNDGNLTLDLKIEYRNAIAHLKDEIKRIKNSL